MSLSAMVGQDAQEDGSYTGATFPIEWNLYLPRSSLVSARIVQDAPKREIMVGCRQKSAIKRREYREYGPDPQ